MKVWVVYGRDEKWNEEAVWGVYTNIEDAKEKMINVNERGHFAKVEEWEVKGGSVNYIFPKGRFIEYLSQKLGILEGEAEELICGFDRGGEE